ncbi:hypothetical protein GQ602_002257 [Ophiocordyceps camponoti-floridani]|uniref:Uncharacterized protein n=1 Tax=Ophiocordyceps camponoti-floridani TaxID=2030778 RepID=A0A8H4VFD8_9HYPO|nr:hypothetical protein GQ602_002257 [Ophiocordyceps camponoti-floridani]
MRLSALAAVAAVDFLSGTPWMMTESYCRGNGDATRCYWNGRISTKSGIWDATDLVPEGGGRLAIPVASSRCGKWCPVSGSDFGQTLADGRGWDGYLTSKAESEGERVSDKW